MSAAPTLLLLAVLSGGSQGPANDAAAMFAQLRTLEGRWQGTYEWSQGRVGSGELAATFYPTANGSALVEDLLLDGQPHMTSVYHLDGSDLRMTHYCVAGNQPRFKTSMVDMATRTAEFAFVDVTNTQAQPAHVVAFSVQIISPTRLLLKFTFGGRPGQTGVETVTLTRVGA